MTDMLFVIKIIVVFDFIGTSIFEINYVMKY